LLLLLLFLSVASLFSQEPIRIVRSNLNALRKPQLERAHVRIIVIDSSTDFKNIDLIKDADQLNLDI